jgi:hypothetical protein
LRRCNPPIGALQRQYGRDPATVSAHGIAFADQVNAAVMNVLQLTVRFG